MHEEDEWHSIEWNNEHLERLREVARKSKLKHEPKNENTKTKAPGL